MKVEQRKDDDISEIRSMILSGLESKDVEKHYLLVDGLVSFISNVDNDPRLRLFIPKHIRSFVLTQYHDQMVTWVFRKHLIPFVQNIIGQICLKNFTK